MNIVVFNKEKFDVFMNGVAEEFKGKPTQFNLLVQVLESARVQVQVENPQQTQDPPQTDVEYANLDSNKAE